MIELGFCMSEQVHCLYYALFNHVSQCCGWDLGQAADSCFWLLYGRQTVPLHLGCIRLMALNSSLAF